jgi:hypothetical protein
VNAECCSFSDDWEPDMESLRGLQRRGLATLAVAAAVMATSVGCQVQVGGQTLPSAYYMTDDIQYFPAGPEFKLSREAAALKAAREAEMPRP